MISFELTDISNTVNIDNDILSKPTRLRKPRTFRKITVGKEILDILGMMVGLLPLGAMHMKAFLFIMLYCIVYLISCWYSSSAGTNYQQSLDISALFLSTNSRQQTAEKTHSRQQTADRRQLIKQAADRGG